MCCQNGSRGETVTNNRSLANEFQPTQWEAGVAFIVNMRTAFRVSGSLREPPVSQERLNWLIMTHESYLSFRLCAGRAGGRITEAPVGQCVNSESYLNGWSAGKLQPFPLICTPKPIFPFRQRAKELEGREMKE